MFEMEFVFFFSEGVIFASELSHQLGLSILELLFYFVKIFPQSSDGLLLILNSDILQIFQFAVILRQSFDSFL